MLIAMTIPSSAAQTSSSRTAESVGDYKYRRTLIQKREPLHVQPLPSAAIHLLSSLQPRDAPCAPVSLPGVKGHILRNIQMYTDSILVHVLES